MLLRMMETIEITGPVETFKEIATRLHKANVQPEEAGLRMTPKQEMELDPDHTVQVLKALETIEDLDDVQNVYSNLKVSDEAIAALEVCITSDFGSFSTCASVAKPPRKTSEAF